MSKQNKNQYFFRFNVITDVLSHRKNGKPPVSHRKGANAQTVATAEISEGDEEGDSQSNLSKSPKLSWMVRIR